MELEVDIHITMIGLVENFCEETFQKFETVMVQIFFNISFAYLSEFLLPPVFQLMVIFSSNYPTKNM